MTSCSRVRTGRTSIFACPGSSPAGSRPSRVTSAWSCWSARWRAPWARQAALRRFQYACNPVAILVCAVHGQVEPACLLFSLAAFAVVLRAGTQISGRAAATAGILLGLGIGTKTWPVLFGPALLLALPSARRRWQFAAAAAGTVGLLFVSMPLTVGTPVSKLLHAGQDHDEARGR